MIVRPHAGLTLPLTHPDTGEIIPVQIFVATLGASNYTYAEATLTQQLLALNTRLLQMTKQSRADLFQAHDRPALCPLPDRPYEVGIWSRARVHLDYHIEYDHRFYSVPYTLLKQQIEVREAGNVVEIFHQGERVASHVCPLPLYARRKPSSTSSKSASSRKAGN